jgi:hypothetical protein
MTTNLITPKQTAETLGVSIGTLAVWRCSKRTMLRLETEELVYTNTVYYFGVSWQRYFVSSKGFHFIENALKQFKEVIHHA